MRHIDFFLGLVVLLIGSCLQPKAAQDQGLVENAATNDSHWIHDAQLRQIMAELEREKRVSWPQEIEDEYTAARSESVAEALGKASQLADKLAEAAIRIPRAVAPIEMAEVDRRSFQSQVDTLRDQALRLQTSADAGDLEAMRRTLASIDATCNSCHQRFRDFSGPIDPDLR